MDEVIQQYLDWDAARPYLGDLARGFWVTIQIALAAVQSSARECYYSSLRVGSPAPRATGRRSSRSG